jgi:diacylglycerol kinase family enzyme
VLAVPSGAALAWAAVRAPQDRRGVAAALGGGAALAVGTRSLWPVAPRTPAEVHDRRRIEIEPAPGGAGAVIAVNPSSGSADGDLVAHLAALLPAAEVVELDDPAELVPTLEEAAGREDVRALGVVGGDGSINAAASVAFAAGRPLLVVPGGTLNHLARDLGVESPEDAAEALQTGNVSQVDLPRIDGRAFLNTASFGSYSELVDAREELEGRIGKWPALVVALVRVLRRGAPIDVELDDQPTSLWMIFIGNCCYHPEGFAPTWRERLDDGLLDVRVVDAAHPFCRARLVLALLTGRLGRTRVYRAWTTDRLKVRAGESVRLACDGETFDGSADFLVEKSGDRVALYTPARD